MSTRDERWEAADEANLQREEADFRAGQRWDQPVPDEPPTVRLGRCLNCGRSIYGVRVNGKDYPDPCDCWEIEPQWVAE